MAQINAQNNKCGLQTELKKLKESSKEAIEGIEKFSAFKEYMHISRKVEEELLSQLEKTKSNKQLKKLILVCGSVGDGKSHVISQLKNKYEDLLSEYIIHNDATESDDPKKNYKVVLDELLTPFSDAEIDNCEPYKLMIAINLGTLSNFIEDEGYRYKYTQIRTFVNKNKIIEDEIVDEYKHDLINYVNFSDYSLFHLSSDGTISLFIGELFEKITRKTEENPFYKSYVDGCMSACTYSGICPLKNNYNIFSNKIIQQSITQLIIEAIIKHKIIVSVRSLLDFIYGVLVPLEFESLVVENQLPKMEINLYNEKKYWKLLLPNALFEHKNKNNIFSALHYLDPLNDRIEEIDDFLVEINTLEDKNSIFLSKFNTNKFEFINVIMQNIYIDKIDYGNLNYIIKTYLRSSRLLNDAMVPVRETYISFTKELFNYNIGDELRMENLYKDVIDSIYKWNGNAENNWINIDVTSISNEFTISQELKIKPDVKTIKSASQITDVYKFEGNLKIKLKNSKAQKSVDFIIDYDLYELLKKVNNGYKLNSKDKENYIAFIDSLKELMGQGEKNERVKITYKSSKNTDAYYLEKDMFGGYTFE